jgi:DNA polymerase-3 subunit epsilon
MADAEMAAHLLLFLGRLLRQEHGIRQLSHERLCQLQRTPLAKVPQLLEALR